MSPNKRCPKVIWKLGGSTRRLEAAFGGAWASQHFPVFPYNEAEVQAWNPRLWRLCSRFAKVWKPKMTSCFMTCKMNNSEKVWKSMEKFNLLKVSISSCNSAVPPINVISCTGTTNLTKDWISGWRFRRQNFEFSNPARFEAFWPVACWRMWIQGSSRSFPTPWPLWVSCQDVQNATFWEFQCSTPTDSNDQGEVLCLWKKLPDLQMPKSAGLDVVVGYVNKGSGAGWEREQIVTFVFFTMSGSVIEWYWCHICTPEGCVVQALLWGDVICLSSTFHQNILQTRQQIGNRRSVSSDSFERSVGSILVDILKTRVDAFLKWHVGLRLIRSSWPSWHDFQTWLDIWGSFGMM